MRTSGESRPALSMPLDVRTALKEAMARLRAAHVPSHTLAAELLLMHALGRDRTWLYTNPESQLDPGAVEDILSWCRLTGHALVSASHPVYQLCRRSD